MLRTALALAALASPLFAQVPLDFTNVVDLNQDSTPLGTHVDLEVHPDSGTLTPYPLSAFITDPQKGIVFQGRTYFYARTADHGDELWVTDGTAGGTERITDINPGPGHAFPRSFVEYQGKLYFAATSPETGRELYVSDGTRDGTKLVGDIHPGTNGVLNETWTETYRYPDRSNRLVVYGDKLYFRGWRAKQGAELWVSDGTAAGTKLFFQSVSGLKSGRPAYLTATSQGLYFAAYVPDQGREVWRTDGTKAGTVQVSNVSFTKGENLGPIGFTEIGPYVLFSAVPKNGERRGFSTQGSIATTVELGLQGHSFPDFAGAKTLGNYAYFASLVEHKLYRTDGTPAGTQTIESLQVADPGSSPRFLTLLGSRLIYAAFTKSVGRFFAIDATGQAQQIGPGPINMNQPLVSDGSFVYATGFGAKQVHRTDGTPAGTALLQADWINNTVRGMVGLASGGALAFAERIGTGVEPQVVPASGPASFPLAELNPGVATGDAAVKDVAAIGTQDLYFAATPGTKTHAYRWSPQDGLVQLTGPSFPATNNGNDGVGGFVPLWTGTELKVLFTGTTSKQPHQLWITDGVADSAVRLLPTSPSDGIKVIEGITVSGNHAFIQARKNAGGNVRLYVTDGTVNGTRMLDKYQSPSGPQPLTGPTKLTPYAGGVAFFNSAEELIWSDGTTKGTRLLHAPVGGYSKASDLAVAHGKLGLINKKKGTTKWELRVVDLRGSTPLVREDIGSSLGIRLGRIGPDLYFSTYFYNGSNTTLHHRTDLTKSGTKSVGSSPFYAGGDGYSVPIHLGTQPGRMLDAGPKFVALFDGQSSQLLRAEKVLDAPALLKWDGPRMVLAGGGLIFSESGDHGEAQLSGGNFAKEKRPLWTKAELGELHAVDAPLRDLVVQNGQLLMVYNDRYGKGEELYAAPLPYAYVRDIDVARTAFHIEASDPIVGQPFRVSGIGAPPFVPVVLFAGALRDTPVASGFGQLLAPDAPLWLDLGAAIPYALGVGPHWTQLSTLPDAPALLGLRVGLQAGYLAPKTNLIHASNALELGLGLGL